MSSFQKNVDKCGKELSYKSSVHNSFETKESEDESSHEDAILELYIDISIHYGILL